MNHEDRLQEYDRKMAVVQKHLDGVAGVRAHQEPYDAYFSVRLHVTVDRRIRHDRAGTWQTSSTPATRASGSAWRATT